MRFAGCCNISCKRIDAVEHSDDLGASRKGRNLQVNIAAVGLSQVLEH